MFESKGRKISLGKTVMVSGSKEELLISKIDLYLMASVEAVLWQTRCAQSGENAFMGDLQR